MKEKIYTIPINDAFAKDCECAICEFERQEELSRIDYTVGASMMEPDERIFTNERGFCRRHSSMLLKCENKLSLALVLKTHTDSLVSTLEEISKLVQNDSSKGGLFGSKKSSAADAAAALALGRAESCAVCERLNETMDKFCENIFYLYDTDDEFRQKFLSSKGFCLNHYALLMTKASKCMNGKKLKDFCIALTQLEESNLRRISDDADWFSKKFDYRYANEDWKNSRDAVPRAAAKITEFTD